MKEWQGAFARALHYRDSLGTALTNLGPKTAGLAAKYQIAKDYLSHLVPQILHSTPPFSFFSGEEIEDFLVGTSYSQELETLGLLPIAEFENDKLCCLDGEYPAFVVLQLGMGTVQPLRKYLLHRTPSVVGFIEYLQWRKPPAPSDEPS